MPRKITCTNFETLKPNPNDVLISKHLIDKKTIGLVYLVSGGVVELPIVYLLYLRMFSPDDLAAVVHGNGWLLPSQLDHDGPLIVADTEGV